MASRLDLQLKLEELIGNTNVYYQKPPSRGMDYPCILYKKDNITTDSADDTNYIMNKRYELIVISRTPDHPVIEELLKLEHCSYNRPYTSDNLYHDVLTIYY